MLELTNDIVEGLAVGAKIARKYFKAPISVKVENYLGYATLALTALIALRAVVRSTKEKK